MPPEVAAQFQKLFTSCRDGHLAQLRRDLAAAPALLQTYPDETLQLLDVAVRNRNTQEVACLLQAGARVAPSLTGPSVGLHPFRRVVGQGDTGIARLFLKAGADPNTREFAGGDRLIFDAIRNDDAKMVETLLGGGADPRSITTDSGEGALTMAAHLGFVDIVDLLYTVIPHPTLIERCAHGDSQYVIQRVRTDPRLLTHTDERGNTLLHWAAWLYQLEVVDYLLENGGFTDRQNAAGETPLHRACRQQLDWTHPSRIPDELTVRVAKRILIRMGKDIWAPYVGTGQTEAEPVWQVAAEYGNAQLVSTLLDAGLTGDAMGAQKRTLLECVCRRQNDAALAEKVLARGGNPRARTSEGWTMLHLAAWHGNDKLLKILTNAGVDVNSVDDSGMTPLHRACRVLPVNTNVITELLQLGADINACSSDGNTPLHNILNLCAVSPVSLSVVRLLVEKGANVTLRNGKGERVLNIPNCGDNLTSDIAVYLFQHGCDVDILTRKDMIKNKLIYSESLLKGSRDKSLVRLDILQQLADLGSANALLSLGEYYDVSEQSMLAADRYYRAGLRYLENGDRDAALMLVDELAKRGDARLAGQLRDRVYRKGAPSPKSEETLISSGTGWVLTNGLVVTCHHVVGKHSKVTLYSSTFGKRLARVVAKDAATDLAVLSIDGPVTNTLRGLAIQLTVAQGARVLTIGYPHVDLLGLSPKVTDGIVSSLMGVADDPRRVQISVPVQSGNSGGPLLNMKGEVVGVVVGKLSAPMVYNATGDMPENVNYAIKVAALVDLLRDVPPDLRTEPCTVASSKVDLAMEDVVDAVGDSVVLVIAEK